MTAGELTRAELAACAPGMVLHWTNWPGRPSVPVTVLPADDLDGNVTLPGGRKLFAMPDELTWEPRPGLGQPGDAGQLPRLPAPGDEIEYHKGGRSYCVRATGGSPYAGRYLITRAESGAVCFTFPGYRIRRVSRASFGQERYFTIPAQDVRPLRPAGDSRSARDARGRELARMGRARLAVMLREGVRGPDGHVLRWDAGETQAERWTADELLARVLEIEFPASPAGGAQ